MAEKKNTYNAEAQRRYDKKRKKIACSVSLEKYDIVKTHAAKKGYNSLNSYVLNLIDEDLKRD